MVREQNIPACGKSSGHMAAVTGVAGSPSTAAVGFPPKAACSWRQLACFGCSTQNVVKSARASVAVRCCIRCANTASGMVRTCTTRAGTAGHADLHCWAGVRACLEAHVISYRISQPAHPKASSTPGVRSAAYWTRPAVAALTHSRNRKLLRQQQVQSSRASHEQANALLILNTVVTRRFISPASIFCRLRKCRSESSANFSCVSPFDNRTRRTFAASLRTSASSF